MEDGVIFAIVVGAIIQVVVLIVFFVMASDVSKIKGVIRGNADMGERYYEMALEEKHIGNTGKAKEYLLRARYRFTAKGEKYAIVGENGTEYIIKEIDKLLSELK